MKISNIKDLILFENDEIIAVNKPPFIASVDERFADEINMLRLVKQYWEDAQICHRLDKETSGVLLFAKTPEAYRSVSMQFEHRKVVKVYHAVIHGTHAFEDKTVNLPIATLSKGRVTIDMHSGKEAETVFNSLTYYKHFTLVECRPKTGRMHQIRIHLATQRASIVADEMYGGKLPFLSEIKKKYHLSKDEEEQPLIKRFALHAQSINFKLLNGESIEIIAPYPKDFTTFIKLLDKYDK